MHILNALLTSRSHARLSDVKPLCLALVALVTLGLTACEKPKGTLKITTSPSDAEIYINGERMGNSPAKKGQPFEVEIAEGEYTVEAKIPKDEYVYKCENKEVAVSANALQTVNISVDDWCFTKKGEQQKAEMEKLEAPSKKIALASDAYRNLPSRVQDFVINSNGTVYDKRTKFEWMRCSLGQTIQGNICVGNAKTYTWQEAQDIARGYHFAGHDDWHLPNIWELETLVHCSLGREKPRDKHLDLNGCSGNYKSPAIVRSVFPNTYNGFYWSSSPFVNSNNNAWGVSFYYGYDSYYNKSYSYRARLVRIR